MTEPDNEARRRWLRRAGMLGLALLSLVAVGLLVAFLMRPPPVEVVAADTGTVRETVEGPGTVQAHIATTVGTRITGVLTATLVDQGASVTRGDLLARLDDGDLRARVDAAQAAVVAARDGILAAEAAVARSAAELELTRARHARIRDLADRGVLSRDELDGSVASARSAEAAAESAAAELAAARSRTGSAEAELRYAREVLSHARIEAPSDGLIIAREAEVGDTVVAGAPIYEMVDPSTLWVAVRVDETVVGRLIVGQPATIRLRSGAEVAGRVARIGHRSDATMRELEVNVSFEQPPARIVINEEARVAITVAEGRGTRVPPTALLHEGGRRGVLVVRNGRAGLRPGTTGPRGPDGALIEAGLRPGEPVVRDPAGIDPGQRVRATSTGQRR